MAIEFPCWSCGKQLKAVDSLAGRKCKCMRCDSVNSIPGDRLDDDELEEEEEDVDGATDDEPEEPVEVRKRQSPEDLAEVREQYRNIAFYFMTIFGGALVGCGLLILGYFLFIYDTSVAVPYQSWLRQSEVGRMNTQLIASISSGVMMLVGAIMIGFAMLRK